MSFDPFAWAVGFAASQAIRWLVSKPFTENLPAQLLAAAKDWEKQVPDEIRPFSDALFYEPPEEPAHRERPHLTHLRNTFQDQIPTRNDWLNALKEQWEWIRTKEFMLTPSSCNHGKWLNPISALLRRSCMRLAYRITRLPIRRCFKISKSYALRSKA